MGLRRGLLACPIVPLSYPDNLFADKSLFKAKGPVWHKKNRKAGIIPKGLRNIDMEASWSKSAYFS